MRNDEPLEGWLEFSDIEHSPEEAAEQQARLRLGLDRLAAWLDRPPQGKRRSMADLSIPAWSATIGFAPQDVSRAQELYRRVYATGGPGNSYVQENLLELLAGAEDVRSILFWVEMVDLVRPRDHFAARRRILAMAALARLAALQDQPAAYAALLTLAAHARPEVRAEAIYYLGRAYLFPERPLPPDVADELTGIAAHDTAFLPRFQARAVLRDAGLPLPMDNPGGVYELKVTLSWARGFHCVIAARSEDSLEELHWAIQDAFGWDADHLYSFAMNGQLYDERYAFASPDEEERPALTSEAIIGELGLTLNHSFLYYFDYGDSHEFEVKVVGIRTQSEPGQYPRVIARSGTPPDQYPDLEEDYEESWEEDDDGDLGEGLEEDLGEGLEDDEEE